MPRCSRGTREHKISTRSDRKGSVRRKRYRRLPSVIFLFRLQFGNFPAERAEQMVSTERSKVTALLHKMEELRQLLRDKTLAMETLNKMLHGPNSSSFNRPARHVGNNHSDFGSSGYRKAIEFLRSTGRFSGIDSC